MEKISDIMMQLARIMDAWRVIPRVIVGMYGFMIYKLFVWYTSMPTHEEKSCNESLVATLLDRGVDVNKAMELACTVVDTVGGPTTQQTSFVTIIVGLSSAMFGFYVSSGGKWEFSKSSHSNNTFWSNADPNSRPLMADQEKSQSGPTERKIIKE